MTVDWEEVALWLIAVLVGYGLNLGIHRLWDYFYTEVWFYSASGLPTLP